MERAQILSSFAITTQDEKSFKAHFKAKCKMRINLISKWRTNKIPEIYQCLRLSQPIYLQNPSWMRKKITRSYLAPFFIDYLIFQMLNDNATDKNSNSFIAIWRLIFIQIQFSILSGDDSRFGGDVSPKNQSTKTQKH